MKFKRKPEFIEAIQWDGTYESAKAISEMKQAKTQTSDTNPNVLYIYCDTYLMRVEFGEWVIKNSASPITESTLMDKYDMVVD